METLKMYAMLMRFDMKTSVYKEKGRISILLATYRPNERWLREQLNSLDAQDYPNLELIVCDDSADETAYRLVRHCLETCVKRIEWELQSNDHNMGSNQTFERLTRMASGEYIAYCDQDDIWVPEKLSMLEALIQEKKAVLACSDAVVIDGEGKTTASCMAEVRKRHIFYEGEAVWQHLLVRNFIMGCTMLIRTQIAQAALPFVKHMVHDHWLALYASTVGSVAVSSRPLIRYRIHGGNQTGLLAGIWTREDYINVRILPDCMRNEEISKRIDVGKKQRALIAWGEARRAYALREKGGLYAMLKYGGVNMSASLFEIVAMRSPKWLFAFLIQLVQRNIV